MEQCNDFRTHLGVVIKRARVAATLTQQQVATGSGLSRGTIANIEGGTQGFTIKTFIDITDAIGVDAGSILAEVRAKKFPVVPPPEYTEHRQLLEWLAEFTCQHAGCSCPSAVVGRDARRQLAEIKFDM